MSGWRWVAPATFLVGVALTVVLCLAVAAHPFAPALLVVTLALAGAAWWRPDSLAPGALLVALAAWWITGSAPAFHPAIVAVAAGLALVHGGAAHRAGTLSGADVSRRAALLQLRGLGAPLLGVLVCAAVLTLTVPGRPEGGPWALAGALLAASALIALAVLADRRIHEVDSEPDEDLGGPSRADIRTAARSAGHGSAPRSS